MIIGTSVTYIGSMQDPAGAYSEIDNVNGFLGGNAILTITYATNLFNPQKSLYVNNTDVMTLIFAHSGGWENFVTRQVIINLNSGTTNTIKIKNDFGDGDFEGVNIDKYTVSTLSSGNLALEKSITASSEETTDLVAINVTDGNTGTRWSSNHFDDEWIYVDLDSSYNINRVVLYWENAYGSEYKIQTSDDASIWTDIYEETSGDGSTDDLSVSGTGQYIRMYGITRATEWGYSLYEFEVYK